MGLTSPSQGQGRPLAGAKAQPFVASCRGEDRQQVIADRSLHRNFVDRRLGLRDILWPHGGLGNAGLAVPSPPLTKRLSMAASSMEG